MALRVKGIALSLAPGGVDLAQDIKASSHLDHNVDHPLGTIMYTISCFHCMTVSLAQGGEGLGAMWGRETAERMLHEADFASVEVHELEHDIQNLYSVCRREPGDLWSGAFSVARVDDLAAV